MTAPQNLGVLFPGSGMLIPGLNLGLISEVTNDIADIYACATTEEQAYCVSKAKSYGIFTGVNGSKYNKCIADICAAKQPELTNLVGTLEFLGGMAKEGLKNAETVDLDIEINEVYVDECLTGCAVGFVDYGTTTNLGLISEVTNDIADIYACATTEEQAYCVSKAKSYGIFTGVNGSVYNKCVADICAAKQPELTNLGLFFPGSGMLIPGLN